MSYWAKSQDTLEESDLPGGSGIPGDPPRSVTLEKEVPASMHTATTTQGSALKVGGWVDGWMDAWMKGYKSYTQRGEHHLPKSDLNCRWQISPLLLKDMRAAGGFGSGVSHIPREIGIHC